MQVRFLHCPPPNNLKLIMTPHPHKDILIAIANGLKTDELEVKHHQWQEWQNGSGHSSWMNPITAGRWQVRLIPKTMLFNRQQLPMPMETTPKDGTVVYVADPTMDYKKECWMTWANTPYQEMLLDRGLVHSTSEAAIEWANAMIPFNNK